MMTVSAYTGNITFERREVVKRKNGDDEFSDGLQRLVNAVQAGDRNQVEFCANQLRQMYKMVLLSVKGTE